MSHSPADEYGDLIQAFTSLQAKRQPLEERLRAIEDRRSSTAPAVYEKVKLETLGRLVALDEEASRLRSDAEQVRQSLAIRERTLASEVEQVNQTLEEVRFRHSLGEYTPEQFQQAEAESLAAVEEMGRRLQAVVEVIALIERFLGPSPARASSLPPSVPLHATPASLPAAAEPVAAPDLAPPLVTVPQPEPAPPRTGPGPELEALFGAAPPPPPRLTDLPPPPPVSGAVPAPARPVERDQTRTTPESQVNATSGVGIKVGTREETTEDIRVAARATDRSPRGPVRPTLIVKSKEKDRSEDTYELAPGATLIGRAPENDVILLEESVSRRHARITVEGGDATFEDLGSANGSFLNGERLKPKSPQRLHDNDILKLGQLLALYRSHPDD